MQLNFSQLALSGDTVGSLSMKDDDNDNLTNDGCAEVGDSDMGRRA